MADVNGYATYLLAQSGTVALSPNNSFNARLTPGVTYWYQMSGTDAVTVATTTWLVQGVPDFSATTPAAAAAIALAGLATPVRDVRIVGQWPSP